MNKSQVSWVVFVFISLLVALLTQACQAEEGAIEVTRVVEVPGEVQEVEVTREVEVEGETITEEVEVTRVVEVEVPVAEVSIPIAINPNVTILNPENEVVISVVSEKWAAADLEWEVLSTDNGLSSLGELDPRTGPIVVYRAPPEGTGEVTISVIGRTEGTIGRSSVSFSIEPVSSERNFLVPSDNPYYGTVSLEAGFTPDPFLVTEINIGGEVDVSYLGGDCVGFVFPDPDLRLQWTGSGFLRFFFVSINETDTTLVINDADGNWHCNDDSFSTFHPSVDFSDATSGEYNIWVGNLGGGNSTPGTMHITNQDYNPSNVSIPPEQAVRAYYSAINNRQYEVAWAILSTEFKDKFNCCTEDGDYDFNGYLQGWDNVERVEIVELEVIEQTASTATVFAQLSYLLANGKQVSDDEPYIKLVLNANTRTWLFDDKGPNR